MLPRTADRLRLYSIYYSKVRGGGHFILNLLHYTLLKKSPKVENEKSVAPRQPLVSREKNRSSQMIVKNTLIAYPFPKQFVAGV